jgi:hypothetical protein
MTDKEFKRVIIIGSLLLALLVASFQLKSCDPTPPGQFFINHSQIKDTTNVEYQKSLKDSAGKKAAHRNHLR